jgi:hypothetical protein
MRHPGFDIPRKTSAARVSVRSGFMPWADGNVNQTFAVTKAHGGQTLLAACVQVHGPALKQLRMKRFWHSRTLRGKTLCCGSAAKEGCGQPSNKNPSENSQQFHWVTPVGNVGNEL